MDFGRSMADSQPSRRGFFLLALFFAALSGAAGLIHQLMWTRRMVDVLGASGESTARVFGAFFLGLSVGAAAAAWIVPRIRRPWRLAGIAELFVAATSLGVFSLPSWSDGIWPMLGPEVFASPTGGLVKLGLSAAAVGIPAFFMGLVLPALASAAISGGAGMGRDGVWLYAMNTLGGSLGLLLAVGYLIQRFGAPPTMLTAVSLNAGVGLFCLLVHRIAPQMTLLDGESDEDARPLPWHWGPLAFVSGLAILAAEVAANQMIMLVATLSFHAPATILFCVILLLALGAFAAGPFARITRSWEDSTRLGAVMALAGVAFALTPLGFMAVARHSKFLTENTSVAEFVLKLGGIVLVTIGPAFFIAGLVFPLLLTKISGRASRAASQLAWLLALNGAGGFLGAEFTYRFLLPAAGPFGATAAVGVAYVAIAFVLALTSNHFGQTLPTLAALVFVVWLLKPVERLPLVNPFLGFHTLAQWAGREETVAVVENKQGERSILMSNQYILGGTGAKASQERQAWLPLLLHEHPQDVAFIGLATGTTPGTALADSRVQRITAIELSPLVKQAAAQFFTSVNRGIADDSRASIVAEDGRTYLAACRKKFDVIAGDLFLPWGAGEARLFSLEHFRSVRRALKEGGVFCQWLPLYQLTPPQVETIVATFQKAFPKTFLFASTAQEQMPVLALVGFAGDQGVDVSRMGDIEGISSFVDVPTIQALYLGQWRPKEVSVVNTLGNLAIELDAGRERLTGHPSTKYLQGSRWAIYREELSKQTFP